MPIITTKDIKATINESAFEESNRIFNLVGLGDACETDAQIGVADQFARNCNISHSTIDQVNGCHMTYSGNKASVNKKQEDSKQSLQQNIAVQLVRAAQSNACSPGNSSTDLCEQSKKWKLTPGSHNIENLAETTENLTAIIQDTLSGTCTSSTGGLSTFLCDDSTLNKLLISQGSQVDTIASCVARNIDKDTITQRASISIQQTDDVTIENTLQHLIIVGVLATGLGISYLIMKRGSGKPIDQIDNKEKEEAELKELAKDNIDVPKTSIFIHLKLKLLAIAFVWIVVILMIVYIKKHGIGGKTMTNADLTTPSICQDCIKYENRDDCHRLGLCTWVPKPIHPPNCAPNPAGVKSPIACLSPIAYQQKINLLQGDEGKCTCEPIYDKKTGEQMGNCDNQCPNFRNMGDCLSANCGWAEGTPVFTPAPGVCRDVSGNSRVDCGDITKYPNATICNKTQNDNKEKDMQCKWVIPQRTKSQGGGYCTGDKTYCHPAEKINYASHLDNALILL